MRRGFAGVAFVLLWTWWFSSEAQVFNNLLVANRLQYNRSSNDAGGQLDDWLDVDLWAGNVRLGFRLETHQGAFPSALATRISQRFVEYRRAGLRMRFGNFYEKIGQGLLFQSFELQTLTLDRIERTLVQDRNAEGIWLEYVGNRFEGRLFSAQPRDPFSGQRHNLVRGVDAGLTVAKGFRLGLAATRWLPERGSGAACREYGAARAEWVGPLLNFSSEFAWLSGGPWAVVGKGQAWYSALSLTAGPVAVSLEWKDYREFGLPFANPPTLVPTHSVSLLNRHTHLLNAADERGYQLQATWAPTEELSVVLVADGGSNHANTFDSRYGEWFVDFRYERLGSWMARGIFDRATDRPFNREKIRTVALELERYLTPDWSIFLDVQAQEVEETFGSIYQNALLLVNLARAGYASLALQLDRTTNPLEQHKVLPALVLSATVDNRHQVTITLGGRRAGLLCSGGVCSYVPEFRGVELRVNSRF